MLTKEQVFEIMGKYYGNAHWRWDYSEHDLRLTTEVLDKVNSLGYHFSNLNKLHNTEDVRFVPIILEYYDKFECKTYSNWFLQSICFRSYSEYIPNLVAIYEQTDDLDLKNAVSQCFLQMRCKKYIPEYLRIVNDPNYGENFDWTMDVLCKLRVKEAIPKLLELVNRYPQKWTWTFIWGAPFFKDPSLIPYLEPFLDHPDGEFRSMARKGISKLNDIKSKN